MYVLNEDRLRKLATITVECLPEELLPEDCYDYTEHGDEIARILVESKYNEWAWCCVKVTARYGPFEGHDLLGACSYEDEQDFVNDSGYYKDMVNEALAELHLNMSLAVNYLNEIAEPKDQDNG